MMKKIWIILLLLSTSAAICLGEDITGLYIEDGCIGIRISTISKNEYFVQRVYIDDEHTQSLWHGQAAYVRKKEDETGFYFYWHTGRYDDIPGSDDLMVYEITKIRHDQLDGFYFFTGDKTGIKGSIRLRRFQKKEQGECE
ncbi:hypothetical protein E4N70_05130 [Treponema vincentii]|jgi:hypothetical protein|uniref:hypothetical protein n=1 Tax=Treponema vincentii TaxID=69710 RepID=UPI0020A3051B|nr:hypothetical protein [Treponema vincentii]UTC60941.1 hypothetical protein E4N70_05130 [Treponema vincentii]